MGIVFAWRGDQLNARNSSNGKIPLTGGNSSTVLSSVDSGVAGINGSTSLNMSGNATPASGSANYRPVIWPGYTNTPNGQARSVLIRVRMFDATIAFPLFSIGGDTDISINALSARVTTGGEVQVSVSNEVGQNDTGTTSGAAIGTSAWKDILVCWDGTNGADGLEVFVDGTSRLTDTMTRSLPTWNDNHHRSVQMIALGFDIITTSRLSWMCVDELVIWDEKLANATVDLTSGSGSLNGSSRTAYVDVASFDGQLTAGPVANLGTFG